MTHLIHNIRQKFVGDKFWLISGPGLENAAEDCNTGKWPQEDHHVVRIKTDWWPRPLYALSRSSDRRLARRRRGVAIIANIVLEIINYKNAGNKHNTRTIQQLIKRSFGLSWSKRKSHHIKCKGLFFLIAGWILYVNWWNNSANSSIPCWWVAWVPHCAVSGHDGHLPEFV